MICSLRSSRQPATLWARCCSRCLTQACRPPPAALQADRISILNTANGCRVWALQRDHEESLNQIIQQRASRIIGRSILALALSAQLFGTPAFAADARTGLQAGLKILWEAPIVSGRDPNPVIGPSRDTLGSGLILGPGYENSNGGLTFQGEILAIHARTPVLAYYPSTDVLKDATPIRLDAAISQGNLLDQPPRDPQVITVEPGSNGSIWVGGFANAHMGIDSTNHSTALPAKLDRSGRPIWERIYGAGFVREVVPLSSGGAEILVAGDRGTSWTVEVEANGTPRTKVSIEGGIGANLAPVGQASFIVTGLTRGNRGPTFREDAAFWIIDGSGKANGPHSVRTALNTVQGSNYGAVSLFSDGDGAYVVSSWEDPFHPKPTEIAYITGDGRVAWTRAVPDSVAISTSGMAQLCEPTMTRLSSGDGLAACVLAGKIHLIKFDRRSGDFTTTLLPLPECQHSLYASLFFVQKPGGELYLAGSRPAGNVGPGCSWIGRLTLTSD